jgi:hypothetical protein
MSDHYTSDLTEALDYPTFRFDSDSSFLIIPDFVLDFIKSAAGKWLALDTEETHRNIAEALRGFPQTSGKTDDMADAVLAVLKDSPDV